MPPFLQRQFRMIRGCDCPPEGGLANRYRHVRRLPAPDGDGTILYIHGLGESALCFEHLMIDERLAHWQHLAVDLEGYGKSSWGHQPLSLDQHAEQLEELVRRHIAREARQRHTATEARGDGSVIVVGHSMGGVIGTRLCERLGTVARAFVNIEGNVSLPDCGFSSRAVKYPLDAWLEHGFDQVLDVIYDDESESSQVRRAYGASIQMCDPRAYHLNSAELVEISTTETGGRCLAALDAKVVYIHGAPRGAGERSLELLRQAGIETIGVEDAGHWPFLDQHDAFADAMAGFLDGLSVSSPDGS